MANPLRHLSAHPPTSSAAACPGPAPTLLASMTHRSKQLCVQTLASGSISFPANREPALPQFTSKLTSKKNYRCPALCDFPVLAALAALAGGGVPNCTVTREPLFTCVPAAGA